MDVNVHMDLYEPLSGGTTYFGEIQSSDPF